LFRLRVRSVLISESWIEIDLLWTAYDQKRDEVLIPDTLMNVSSCLLRVYRTKIDDWNIGLGNSLRPTAQQINALNVALLLGFAIKESMIRIRKERFDDNVVGGCVIPKFVEDAFCRLTGQLAFLQRGFTRLSLHIALVVAFATLSSTAREAAVQSPSGVEAE
jgi:hypothetical protein